MAEIDLRKLKKELKSGKISREEYNNIINPKKSNIMPKKDDLQSLYQNVKATNSPDIKITDLTLLVHGIDLLKDTELIITNKRKYGLIGYNGSGKTSLLNEISNRNIPIQENISILYVKQEIEPSDKSPVQYLLESDTQRLYLLQKEKELKELLETIDDEDNTIQDELLDIYQQLKSIGAYSAESRARNILSGLQFTQEMQNNSTTTLSGGWRMRVALACALFIKPVLLLLDEPTNHLDLNAAIWLEAYLQKYNNTLVIVSHDREFLNNIVTDIIHLHNKKLTYHKGNYESFIKNKKDAKPDRRLLFLFRNQEKLKIPNIQIKDVSFSYDDKLIFKNVELNVDCNSKVAIIGPNGSGKTTLMNLINKKLEPTEGEIFVNHKLRISKFSQHFIDQLDITLTPVQYIGRKFPLLKEQEIKNACGMFGLGGQTHNLIISSLSGGQKCRLCMCEISLTLPHILLLDEPTNHLDMESVDALIEGLNKFTGGIVFITHDQRLVTNVANELWICENNTVTIYDGTFDDYKKNITNLLED